MNGFLFALATGMLLGMHPATAAPETAVDHREKFDKSSYKGTIWTQVNPWWHPDKPAVDGTGGPNYAFKEHRSYEQWGSAFADLNKDGIINLQIELHVPAPGFAHGMKKMMKEAKEKNLLAKFGIFLVYYGEKNVEKDIQNTIAQFDMLRDELKNSPQIFRVDGRPVISIYTGDYFTPEEWGRVIPEVEKKCGKFIWLISTCRNPTLDADPAEVAKLVRNYLPYFDGITQYGNYTEKSQKMHYEILSPIMKKEFPGKIFEASIQNAYSNHFHMGGVATQLSQKWRDCVEHVLKAGADSFVMTNFFDHYENSLILPCYEREDFLIRYAMCRLSEWRGVQFVPEKTPELVVTNFTAIRLGEPLRFEVIGFPIDGKHKKVALSLDVCDTSGKVLHSFPETEMDLSNLSVKEFAVPSERFPDARGIVSHLRYRWIGREFSMPYGPVTFVSPSIRTNMMFWARSTRNLRKCNVVDPAWSLGGQGPGATVKWPSDGILPFSANVKALYASDPRKRDEGGFFRIMRNGLEWRKFPSEHMVFNRVLELPPPSGALNSYHLEFVNEAGYKYATLPVWVTSGERSGKVSMPIRCGDETRNLEIEKARVPYFYYPCDSDTGALFADHSGYQHNGRLNGNGYGGGHLGYTGYHYYHNGSVDPLRESPFQKDSADGRGMLRFTGKNYILIFGGTAFPGASTYEISVRPETLGEKMGIFGSANRQINVCILPDGRVQAERGSEIEGMGGAAPKRAFLSRATSKTRLKKGEWSRIAVVYDMSVLKLYLDGKLEDEVKSSPLVEQHSSINHLSVGSLCAWLYKPEAFFRGDLRDVRIYGRNLSPQEFLK